MAAGVETLAYVGCRLLLSWGVVFYAPRYDSGEYANYMTRRDPELGWPARDALDVDSSGSRRTPAFPDPVATSPRLSAYGDSFVWADEVDDAHAWPNILSRLLGMRVSNFGVRGYGTDQAYLRFVRNTDDPAQVVLLGFMTENIIRNVNQYRQLIYPNSEFALKPRYILNAQNQLELVPLPTFSKDDYAAMAKNPNLFLSHEYFRLDGPSGTTRVEFPYFFSLLRAARHYRIQGKLKDRPSYVEFYRRDHPSQGIEVTLAILEEFVKTARQRHKTPLILLIPNCRDLEYFKRTGQWPYSSIIEKLKSDEAPFLNTGDALFASLGPGNPCSLCQTCGTHFTERANELLAHIVYDHVRELVSPLQPPVIDARLPKAPVSQTGIRSGTDAVDKAMQ